MEIRTARPDEYREIGALTHGAYAELFDGEEMGDYADALRDVGTRATTATVVVADEGGDLVGNVTYVPDVSSAMAEFDDPAAAGIRMLAVRSDQQGKGIGKALTEWCIDQARRDGKDRIFLHTTNYMPVARAMYERIGFVRFTALDFSHGPVEILGYRLDLNGETG